MEKTKNYNRVKFSADRIKEVFKNWEPMESDSRFIDFGSHEWRYDNDSEFFADFSQNYKHARFSKSKKHKDKGTYKIGFVSFPANSTSLTVQAPSRAEIEDVFLIFDKDWEQFKLPEVKKEEKELEPIIFIGHGKSAQWRDLKDHLTDKHGYKVIAYETGARAGHTIRDILDDMLDESSFAILVMTGEDEMKDGTVVARPNVIHETGLFQGKLGFSRAIVLLEENTVEFSNLFGIQQIRYSKGKIKETFGDVLATIKREFD